MRFTRPPTAQEAVLAALRELIVTGELAPGTPVRQEALAERLGVSRVPLREALKVLEGEGQVVYRPHRGYAVAELSVEDLLEVYRIRDLLEDEAVREAVPRLTPRDLDEISAAEADVRAAAATGDIAAITAANRRLHFAVYEASAMPRMVRMIRVLWDATDVYRSLYFAEAANRARIDEEHAAAIAAMRAGDTERAVAVLAEHRRASAASVSAAITARPGVESLP